jgi:uncharacterized protein YkwD
MVGRAEAGHAPRMNTRSLITSLGLFVAALLIAVCPKPASASAATIRPRTALLYRINQIRADHHLAPVYPASSLQATASHHSADMLVRGYFGHNSPTGSTLYTRITNSGFVNGYSWLGGETLAWGSGTLATPKATVNAWLASPEHRAIMLSTTYRRIGISRTCGHYQGHPNACVWTADWIKRW